MTHLAGKVAIVTGGGRGLGRAHAIELAKQGAAVIVNDLGVASFTGEGDTLEDPASDVVAAIRASGGEAETNTDDISDWDGAQAAVQSAIDTFGRLDIVVNNAAISRFGTIEEISRKDWESSIAVNLTGTAAICHWAAVHWRSQGPKAGRRIVNTASGVGLSPVRGNPMYVASKAGIAALTVACAIELAELGVRANAIAPVARTRISEFVAGDAIKAPIDRFDKMDPNNVAAVVAYLASPACDFTGRVFGIVGSQLALYEGWSVGPHFDNHDKRWSQSELEHVLADIPRQVQSFAQSIPGVLPQLTPSDDVLKLLAEVTQS